MIVISFLAIILDISVIGLIIDVSNVWVLLFGGLASVCVLTPLSLKVIPQSWILIKGDPLELPIGVEAEDKCEEIVCKADD